MNAPAPKHVSVLPSEVITLLTPQPGETWIDATTGGGGHTRLIADAIGTTGRVLALDQDPTMLELARPQLEPLSIRLIHANFDQLASILAREKIEKVDGLLADLGFCSDQLANADRGLSFQQNGPLDMRLDPTRGEPASYLIQHETEFELADIFWRYGEERRSRRVARRIVETRKHTAITTTHQLAELVRQCVPRERGRNFDPATRVFQGLRIAVNDELGSLERLLAQLPNVIKNGGRVGIISFHSLEDRLVKYAFRERTIWQPLTKKPVIATDEEIAVNPRARSAKFRTAKRL